MQKATALKIIDQLTKMHLSMNEVIHSIEGIEDGAEKKDMRRAIASLVSRSYTELMIPILRQYPELDPDGNAHDVKPDGPLSAAQQAIVEALSTDQIAEIDKALLTNCNQRWRKVAAVVGFTMSDDAMASFPGVPDIFYALRVRSLVENGVLEASGNLDYMRYSEVRLSRAPDKE
jgi:hypothetical protein